MMADIDGPSKVSSEPKSICSTCLDLEEKLIALLKINDKLACNLNENKVVKGNEKLFSEKNKILTKQVRELEIALLKKQDAITAYLDKIDALKREKASIQVDFETLNQKLNSYSSASYLLDHMLREQRNDKGKSGIGYNNCPPPVFNKLINTPKDEEDTELIVEKPTESAETQNVQNENVKSNEQKGKGVSNEVDGNLTDWESDSEEESKGLGCQNVSRQGPNVQKQVAILKSNASPSWSNKIEKKPLFKGPSFVKEGETKEESKYIPPMRKHVHNSPPRHHRTFTRSYQNSSPPQNVYQKDRCYERPAQRPKFVDNRTCFECGDLGHAYYNCPRYLQTPQRPVDRPQMFNGNHFQSPRPYNRFSYNRSNSPVRNRMMSRFTQNRPEQNKIFNQNAMISSANVVDQSFAYFKQPQHQAHMWRSKAQETGAGAGAGQSEGKWMDLPIMDVNGNPTVIRAWVPMAN